MGEDVFQAGYKYTVTATIDDGKISAKITINGNTIEGWKDAAGKIAFIGDAATSDVLNDEEKAAYSWLISNYTNVTVDYIPATKTDADLSDYLMVWAHWNDIVVNDVAYNIDGAVKAYYAAGGNILASREAMTKLIAWGIIPDGKGITVFARDEVTETLGYAPGIEIVAADHSMFAGFEGSHVDLRPNGFYSEKKMLFWKFGEDANDETGKKEWIAATGATVLAQNGSEKNTVTMAEFTNEAGGDVIAIGDPAFEWNKASDREEDASEIQNLYKLAKNTVDYLMKK